jgi:hypothetical protein
MEKEEIFRFEDFIDVEKLTKMKSNLIKEGIINESESEDDDEHIDHSLNPYNVNNNVDGVDYDAVADSMRDSYGDAVMNNIEDFEKSETYNNTKDTTEYINQFSVYMNGLATGESEEDYEEDNHFDFGHSEVDDDDYKDRSMYSPYYEESNSESEDYYKLYKDKAEDFRCDIAVEGVNQSDTEVRLIVESDEWTLMFVGEIKNGQCVIPMKKLSILNEGAKGNIRLEVNADGTLFTPWEDKFVVKASKKVTVSLNENKTNKKSVKTGISVKVSK